MSDFSLGSEASDQATMIRAQKLLALITTALAISAGCNSSSPPTTSSTSPSTSCSVISDLVLVPATDPIFGGYALAKAGPVWFSAFGPVRSGKANLDFSPGYPTKVVIHPNAGPHPPVQLRGLECATGKPFHFCYNQGSCGFSGQPVTEQELASRGDAVLTIDSNQHEDDTGYMLFPRRGRYMVSARDGNRILGSVVFQVG